MLTKKITTKKETTLKEKITSEITLLLTSALATLKDGLGEKKFEKRIKKAAKLLSAGIKTSGRMKPVAAKEIIKPTIKKTKVKKEAIPKPAKKTVKPAVKKVTKVVSKK